MRTNKTLYGFMAFGPLLLILVSFVLLFGAMAAIDPSHNREFGQGAAVGLFGFFGLIIIASILSIVSMIMFIVHISKNKLIPEDQRIFWILGMVLANGITNIIYFFMYISKEDELMRQREEMERPRSQWD